MHNSAWRIVRALLIGIILTQLSAPARAQPSQSYTVFSAITLNAPGGPLVLGATFPGGSSGGLVQTVNYDPAAMDQVWTVLPILNGPSVLLHRSSGMAARFGASDTQITLAPFIPYDPAFLVSIRPYLNGMQSEIWSASSPDNMMIVDGSNIYPQTRVMSAPTRGALGQQWLLLPLAE